MVFNDMQTVVQDNAVSTSFKHFLAYKGALMVNDDELFASFNRLRGTWVPSPMVHAENGDVVADIDRKASGRRATTAPKATPIPAHPQVEGEATNRAIMIADMAGRAALCGAYLL